MTRNDREYELTIIVGEKTEEKKRKDLLVKIVDWIKKAGGLVIKKEDWGKKEFVYPIKHQREGSYCFFHFKIDPKELDELKGKLRLEQSIIRFLFIKI